MKVETNQNLNQRTSISRPSPISTFKTNFALNIDRHPRAGKVKQKFFKVSETRNSYLVFSHERT